MNSKKIVEENVLIKINDITPKNILYKVDILNKRSIGNITQFGGRSPIQCEIL